VEWSITMDGRRIHSWQDLGMKSKTPMYMSSPQSLFPLRIGTTYPTLVNGADIAFCCEAREGGTFYCKQDKDGRQIRATEWFFTLLARHLNILTPDCAVLEDVQAQETFFGSLNVQSAIADFEAKKFLTTSQRGELGQPSEWPGAYLSSLYAFDLFAGNVDRAMNNFFVVQEGFSRKLCSFDFASSAVLGMAGLNFPVATDATIRIGRFLRHRHGFYLRTAKEMIDRIDAVPIETIAGFLKQMPDDWLGIEQREGICELWSSRKFGARLLALRTGLTDESLL